jgi:hypothetical protein
MSSFWASARLLRQSAVHHVQGVVFITGDALAPDEKSQHVSASTPQTTNKGTKLKFIE